MHDAGAAAEAAGPDHRRQRVTEALTQWKSQLIDVGGRNQLLYYRDLKVGTLDLSDAEPTALDALFRGRKTAISRLFPGDALSDRLKRARAIRNKGVESLEERGIQTCFAAVGMATWQARQGKGTPAAPVLLRAATLTAVGAAEADFDLTLSDEAEVNPILLHLLSEEYRVTVNAEELRDLLPPGSFDTAPVFERLNKEAGSVPGFGISSRRLLGTFSYAKLPMVADLSSNAEALVAHDAVAAIAGDQQARRDLMQTGGEVDVTDPDRRPPSDEFLVLDADSSQSYAINAVLSGQSIVISGPPGTGKSQTIANMVASLVARGASVLFVAEKRAAISAVLSRLERVGLSDLVLDLHDGARSRRATAESLAAALRAASSVPRPDQQALHELLVDRRKQLNDHCAGMHAKRLPWDLSVFEAQTALIRLAQTHGSSADTSVRIRGSRLLGLDGATARRLSDAIHEFASLGALRLTREDSLWAGANVRSPEQAEQALETAARLTSQTAPEARRALQALIDEAGLTAPRTMAEWTWALALLDRAAAVLRTFDPAMLQAGLGEMLAATAPRAWRKSHIDWPGATDGWWTRRSRVKEARSLCRMPGTVSKSALHDALLEAHEVVEAWRRASVDGRGPHEPGSMLMAKGRFDRLKSELAALGALVLGTNFDTLATDELESALERLAGDAHTLRKLPRINELTDEFSRRGLGALIEDLRLRRLDPATARAVFEGCWYRSVLDRVSFEDPSLANFEGSRHHETVSRYREADMHHVHQTSQRVRRAAAERLIQVRDRHEDQSALVQAQAQRKRGHLPLRDLFAAAPDVMTALKPCWAMSPLVVSQLLPGDRPYFDVVVFDEASQVLPADAIPAILRGRRLVVAGDAQQLPPTSFFSAATDGEGEEQQAVNDDGSINLALTSGYESILDVLTAGLGPARSRSLTWHYRSRDERLIAFSNAWIYDRSLTTFPGIIGEECLSHVLVSQQQQAAGQEDSVTAEVERVVELILAHAEQRPAESLGVISMGIKHAERIDVRLRDRLRDLPRLHAFFDEAADERFFVKNLERVQGDERDAIILSIGYGKSADGRLMYRFGPLLQQGGHRRLNVAVTRARSRMTVVSSFSHHDMDPNRSTADGVKMLRAYLQFASTQGKSLGEVAMEKPALNPFEISVRDRLTAAGIPVVAQYGVAGYWIDFAAAHPVQRGRMVLAIEADGASYHSSPTARDRDRLRQEQLERLGWSFHRIWSTDWFTDADGCVARAKAAYERAVAATDAAAPKCRPDAGERAGPPKLLESAVVVPGHLRAQPSTRSGARPQTVPGASITDYADTRLVELIRWIESDTLLRTEDQLFEAFIAQLGFRRRGHRIRAAFDRVLPIARRSP